ncbi:Cyp6a22 [Drosophila busckii]|uniref:Cyp6a22 n=1 Tax=Drosophila busckii TaxID=30019 RepID=A0A0M5JAF5_DROBS|nr:cytochrome P450 6a22-like [Drosophila busckii]ALC41931.1 Cyp6a22 [Drosophila busckii]
MLDLLALLFITMSLGLWYVRIKMTYWVRRRICHEHPSFPMGNMQGLRTQRHIKDILTPMYEAFKDCGDPFAGMYILLRPVVLVLDLELAKHVLIRDFPNFEDRGLYHNEQADPLTGHLFRLDGAKWRALRQKMTPAFSSGRMKYMFPNICAVGAELATVCGELAENSICNIVDVSELISRYTSDVIGSCAFGLDCNGLRNPQAEFVLMGRRAFRQQRHGQLVTALIENLPNWARRLHMRIVHQDISDFYTRIVRDIVKQREEQRIVKNDFMHLLIEMKRRGEITMQELTAQAFVFFIAGFDTSASTTAFALYELAKQPQLQLMLRAEMELALEQHDNEFNYDTMQELRYMELVIAETLRKYPILPQLTRTSAHYYIAKNDHHFYIEPGQMVQIPIYAIQNDPDIYPEPHKFIPERFLAHQMSQRPTASWLPFGDGPRNCIGMRFGKMQTTIALFQLLRQFQFSVCARTESKIQFDKNNLLLSPANGIYLKVEKLHK